jgi:GTP diphosphokinase / guanosine-3',5'-bis(diphosphate) 3'-diphosphatase
MPPKIEQLMTSLEASASQPSSAIAPVKVMTPQFLQALSFAAHKHRDQRRKDTHQTPYINHPIAVANILLNEAGVTDESVLIAALLHDTVEDTQTTFEEIEQHFGALIRAVVAEVTDDRSLPKATRKQQQLEHAEGLSDRARLVKLADKTANLRDITSATPAGWPVSRLDEYLEWGKAVINNLRGTHPELEALFDQAYEQGKATVKRLTA